MKSTTVCAQIHQNRPFLSLLLAAALLITCASCGTDPVIRRIRQNGGLKVGYCSCAPSEDAPFVIAGDSGSSGITAEPAAEIAQGMDTGISFVRLSSEKAYAALLNGSVDCLWNVPSPAKENVSSVRTVETGIYYRQVVMTAAESDITRLADVRGKTMAVVSGSDAQTELHNASVMESSLKEIKIYDTMTQVMDALISGEVHCAVVDEPQALYAAAQNNGAFRWIDTPLAEHSLVIATRAEDADLCALIAEKYVKLSQSGKIEALCRQYAPSGSLGTSMQAPSSEI